MSCRLVVICLGTVFYCRFQLSTDITSVRSGFYFMTLLYDLRLAEWPIAVGFMTMLDDRRLAE